jgi:predicted TIM-barrel fold metal-dependent hydrolase
MKRATVFAASIFIGTSFAPGAALTEQHVEIHGAALDTMVHAVSQLAAERIAQAFGQGEATASGAADVIEMLDEAGVERALMQALGFFGPFVPDDEAVRAENDFVAEEVGRYPDRPIGFCGINPLLSGAPDEIDRCLDLDDMRGIKLNPILSGMAFADEEHAAALAAVFVKAVEHDVPVQLHVFSHMDPPLVGEAFDNLAGIIAEHQEVRVSWPRFPWTPFCPRRNRDERDEEHQYELVRGSCCC